MQKTNDKVQTWFKVNERVYQKTNNSFIIFAITLLIVYVKRQSW